ncbi:transmembrane protein 135-like isoform X2 [Patiria miniata]|uniref:Transmembrane protein 135 N-terminal domain-containing protein n=1 Tax=Patiria miniata TaxID=46514 RepID=A0A914BPH7_PATMI|nr:transmembrane protein 135-like isoform X1 [Patiria miniata]XP_038078044.1 transmembrane protein 135-like isoform X2 [Patiria miniata]
MVAPSKIWKVCSCYEMCHCWNPSCIGASWDIAKASYKFSFRTYVIFYTISTLIFHKGIPDVRKLIVDILRSTNFLASNAILFMSSICVFRRLLGRFFAWFVWGPACVASGIAISMEKKSRRAPLALYMVTLAIELLINIVLSRGWVKPIKYGEVMLFSVSSALGLFLFRYGNVLKNDSLSALKMLVGAQELPVELQPDEVRLPIASQENGTQHEGIQRTQRPTFMSALQETLKTKCLQFVDRLKSLQKHRLCQHQSSCIYYVLQACIRKFAVGYAVQAALNLLRALPKIATRPGLLLQAFVRQDNFGLALFLSLFVAIFRSLSCLLRWLRNKDSPLHALIAGGAAGVSSIFYRSTAISLYFASKILENLIVKGQERGIVPVIPRAPSILFALSTATVLHAGAYEPHNIRPAYWSFLLNLTGQRYGDMNRMLIAHLGTDSTRIYPDWPVYPDLSKLKLVDKDGLCVQSLQPKKL